MADKRNSQERYNQATMILLGARQAERLEQLAAQRGVSKCAVVRGLIDGAEIANGADQKLAGAASR